MQSIAIARQAYLGADTLGHLRALAVLRVERARLEAQFTQHPSRLRALMLASCYEEMRNTTLAAVGVELDDDDQVIA